MRAISASAFLCGLMASFAAFAGAWTQDQGKGQLILNGFYYSTDELWDNQGHKASQPTYTKYELNPYLEYGLTNNLTVGANLSLQHADQSSQGNWGVGDSEFFLRTRVWQKDGFVLSAEPIFKIPSPEGRDLPQIGSRHLDAGLNMAAGYGFSAWGLNHFADLDVGYRYRFGDPKDQVKIAATLGFHVTPKWMIMPQAFATYRTSKPVVASFTESPADNYNLMKLQLSAVYQYTDNIALQIGGFAHVDGKNTGAGNGVLISVWKSF